MGSQRVFCRRGRSGQLCSVRIARVTGIVEQLNERTDRRISGLQSEWDTDRTLPAIEYGPIPWHRDEPPDTIADQHAEFAGLSSVVVFRSEERVETVLVYHRSGYWEPPGGAIEGEMSAADTAVAEASEETGLDIELTDLLYTRPVRYQYADGTTVRFPAVTFVGRETGGSIRPERTTTTHPYATHGVGVFGRDVLPENCRDREQIRPLFEDLPPYDPEPPAVDEDSTTTHTEG
jgi:8-oxo-dGTP pyrophosphatase MutT (NUDIX family)